MTSEIVFMNKKAIVMAADSVVTFPDHHTYEGVDKLFKLTNDPPMGIMIFGSAYFGDVPLETLISNYSKRTNFNIINDILLIKEDFINYLAKNTTISTESKFVDENFEIFENKIFNLFNDFSKEEIHYYLNEYKNEEICSFLEKELYDYKFDKIIKEFNLSKCLNLLKKCFSLDLLGFSSGIVISGFNEKDNFPSIVSFNLFFNDNGKVIFKNNFQKLNNSNGSVFPFAETDVIDTFFSGFNYYIKNNILSYYEDSNMRLLNNIENMIKLNKNIKNEDLMDIIDCLYRIKDFNEMVNDLDNFLNEIKFLSYVPILNSIERLSKFELANIAELLIRMTAISRKINMDLESVGGDIDVAIISKGDGFVWVNNKSNFN